MEMDYLNKEKISKMQEEALFRTEELFLEEASDRLRDHDSDLTVTQIDILSFIYTNVCTCF